MRFQGFLLVAMLVVVMPSLASAQFITQGNRVISVSVVVDGSILGSSGSGDSFRVRGIPGREYSIRVVNLTGSWIEVLAAVDGLDVIDQGPANEIGKRGYVLGPWATYDISGWRTSLDRVDAFRFVSAHASEAAARGLGYQVGQIRVSAYLGDLQEVGPGPVRPLDYQTFDNRMEQAPAASGMSEQEIGRSAKSGCVRCPMPHQENLGTGRGQGLGDSVTSTSFQRFHYQPDQQIFITYGRGQVYRKYQGWLED